MSEFENPVGYQAEISRANPTCFIFMIDQSGSMSDPMPGGRSKKQNVADAVNKLLANLTIRCAREEGVRAFFDIGVIGYGSSVGSAFGGILKGESLVSISKIADVPLRVEERKKREPDGAGGIIEMNVKFPIWFEPVASGNTPMKEAFQLAYTWLSSWVQTHPTSFPPVVINITDGAANSDPSAEAKSLASLTTSDGKVLVFNIHISELTGAAITFPSSNVGLPDKNSELLFEISSVLPHTLQSAAIKEGYSANDQTRGFAFNADMVDLIKFLEIGTRDSNDRMSER